MFQQLGTNRRSSLRRQNVTGVNDSNCVVCLCRQARCRPIVSMCVLPQCCALLEINVDQRWCNLLQRAAPITQWRCMLADWRLTSFRAAYGHLSSQHSTHNAQWWQLHSQCVACLVSPDDCTAATLPRINPRPEIVANWCKIDRRLTVTSWSFAAE